MGLFQHDDPNSTIEPLEEDNDSPASPPDDVKKADTDRPVTDAATNIDKDEVYQHGEASAANIEEPKDSAVEGYDPDKDQRRENES